MTYVFWASALLIGYVYIGYPALLAVWVRLRPRSAKALAEGSAHLKGSRYTSRRRSRSSSRPGTKDRG